MTAALLIPRFIRDTLRHLHTTWRALPYRGVGRSCPVCGKDSRAFRAFGDPPRDEAECAHCGALERHRLLWIFLRERTDIFDGCPRRFLHVAPERCFQKRLARALGDSYLSADLSNPRADLRMDVTDIRFAAESFDAIYCSHVLEHVHDDRKAMREFHRVLKPDGWAILLVPIIADHTWEDPAITDPRERRRIFGQEDHVRAYGPDYADRLREAGFTVRTWTVADLRPPEEARRLGLTPAAGEIFLCTK